MDTLLPWISVQQGVVLLQICQRAALQKNINKTFTPSYTKFVPQREGLFPLQHTAATQLNETYFLSNIK